jgi:hypothetical protein
MVSLNLVVYFGDWSVGEVIRRLDSGRDDQGLTYKKFLIKPDEQTVIDKYGGYDEFEKIAVNKNLQHTVSGDYVIITIWEHHILPIFQYGDQNIMFVTCGWKGEETVFTESRNELLTKIQIRDQEIESLRALVARLGEKLNDLTKRKINETEVMREVIEANKLLRPLVIQKKDDDEDGE